MSSPSYKSRLTPKAKQRMFDWPLSREERNSVWARLLVELPTNPDRHLIDAVRRPTLWAYSFALPASEGRPRRHLTFTVERRDYEFQLVIVDGKLTAESA